jgi:hypothetical protein
MPSISEDTSYIIKNNDHDSGPPVQIEKESLETENARKRIRTIFKIANPNQASSIKNYTKLIKEFIQIANFYKTHPIWKNFNRIHSEDDYSELFKDYINYILATEGTIGGARDKKWHMTMLYKDSNSCDIQIPAMWKVTHIDNQKPE